MPVCHNCNKETEPHLNWCGWDCMVEKANKDGAREHLPNGLPVMCIKHDGTMLEHHHGDHPYYKFPVEVEYTGTSSGEKEKFETHALINVEYGSAMTIYECCYAFWDMRSGKLIGGKLWNQNEWRLTDKSIELIKEKMNV